MKLLLAEDERSMADAIAAILRYANYLVDVVADGEEALAYARADAYDGIILDIMMPRVDGLQVLSTLRADGCRTPILLLSARAEVEDRIAGLDAGADDYLPKPFASGELLARVRAMLRRREEFTPDRLTFADITLDRTGCTLHCGTQSIVLPKLEFRTLELLMLNRGAFLSSEQIFARVWGYDTDTELGAVWVCISSLRKRLLALDAHIAIRVRRGLGYTLEELPC